MPSYEEGQKILKEAEKAAKRRKQRQRDRNRGIGEIGVPRTIKKDATIYDGHVKPRHSLIFPLGRRIAGRGIAKLFSWLRR